MGLFLFSTSTSRLTIDFLSSCGLSTSYSTVLRAHKVLSASLLKKTAEIAWGPHMIGLDNEQISMSQHITQRPGAVPAVRSFTASVIYLLCNATADACRLQPILHQRKISPIITYAEHIIPSHSQKAFINQHLVINIISVLFNHESTFQRSSYADLLRHPAHRPPPRGYKTQEFVAPTLEYDKAKISGFIGYLEDIYLKKFGASPGDFEDRAIIGAYDQLSNSRGRSALLERFGDLTAFLRMENIQLGIGFFHCLMNSLWNLRCIHDGDPKLTGSIANYILLLGVKRLGGERLDFFTLRSLMDDVLFGNILSLWSMKTGYKDLKDYALTNPSPEALESIARDILVNYASDTGLAVCTGSKPGEADNVMYNAILLNRDLLYFYEHDLAISSGDFGRLELSLRTLARLFNGAGARNYSMELLHLIQNLSVSWPKDFA